MLKTVLSFTVWSVHLTMTWKYSWIYKKKTKKKQELRMLPRSLSADCQSLTLNVMIQVLQFVSNSQLIH